MWRLILQNLEYLLIYFSTEARHCKEKETDALDNIAGYHSYIFWYFLNNNLKNPTQNIMENFTGEKCQNMVTSKTQG